MKRVDIWTKDGDRWKLYVAGVLPSCWRDIASSLERQEEKVLVTASPGRSGLGKHVYMTAEPIVVTATITNNETDHPNPPRVEYERVVCRNEVWPPVPRLWYDYDVQAWVEGGYIAICGHRQKSDGCYACHHAGEKADETHFQEGVER